MTATYLCHFCEFDTTGGKSHDCPYIGLEEIEKIVVNAAVNAICGSASITSECRRDAAALVSAYARFTGKECLERRDVIQLLGKAYRYFEYEDELPAELKPFV